MIATRFTAGFNIHVLQRGRIAIPPVDDDTATVRRCDQFRRSLRGAAMSVPAQMLRAPSVAGWVRRHRSGVYTECAGDLDIAVDAGVAPVRITLHTNDDATYTERGVRSGVGRFVIASLDDLEVITDSAEITQRVVVDLNAYPDPHLMPRALDCKRVELVGVHHRLFSLSEPAVEATIAATVGSLSCIRHRYGHLVTHFSFAGLLPEDISVVDLCATSEWLQSAVEDSCARFRYPRPALDIALPATAAPAVTEFTLQAVVRN